MSAQEPALGHPSDPQPAADASTPDPSMEDILASIRRILNEEDAPKPPAALSAPPQAAAPSHDHAEAGVLELEPSMMVSDGLPEVGGPVPAPPPVMVEPAAPFVATPPMPQPTPVPLPMPIPLPVASEPPMAEAVFPPHDALVAPAAAAAAATSVGALMRTLANERTTATHRGGPTIEDLVRDEMRPLLKSWLDQHLAPMVERLVRAEIERVVSRTT